MAKQLKFKIKQHGGKRKGAGRPNLSKTISHIKRPKVDFKKPLHITMRLTKEVPNIRRPSTLKVFRAAISGAKAFDLHVLHFAIQSNHIHMIVETKDNETLARGMKSLTSSFAKNLKREMLKWEDAGSIKTPVFHGRFQLTLVKNPSQMKNTLKYVLLNTAKHEKMIPHMDPYSSAKAFADWKTLMGKDLKHVIEIEARNKPQNLNLSQPRSWLAREGWKRAFLKPTPLGR